MAKIREWAVVDTSASPFDPPERIRPRLAGKVYGHPTVPDGGAVITSSILMVKGRVVVTKSGHSYELDGPPDAGYAMGCKLLGVEIDEANPIRFFDESAPPPGALLN